MPFDDDFEPDAGSDFEPDFVPDVRDIRPLAKQRLDRLASGDPALGDAPPPPPQGPPSLRQVAAGRRDRLVASQLPQTEPPGTPLYHPLRAVGEALAEMNPTNPVGVGDMISAPFKVVPAMRESKNPYFSGIGEWAQEPVAKVSKLTDIYADNPALSFVPGAPPPEAVRMAGRVAEPFTSPEMLASFGVPGTGFGGLAAKVPAFGTAALLHGAAELPEQTQQLLAQTIAGDKEGLRETLPEWGTNAAFTGLAGRHMLGRQEAHDARREAQKDAVAQETAQQTKVAVEQPAVNKAPTHEEVASLQKHLDEAEAMAADQSIDPVVRTRAGQLANRIKGQIEQLSPQPPAPEPQGMSAAEGLAVAMGGQPPRPGPQVRLRRGGPLAPEGLFERPLQPTEIPQNAPGGAEQGGMQPASFPIPPDVRAQAGALPADVAAIGGAGSRDLLGEAYRALPPEMKAAFDAEVAKRAKPPIPGTATITVNGVEQPVGLARRLAAQRAARESVDAGRAPVQPPTAASGPAEPIPAGPAPAEAQPEPVGRPAVAPAVLRPQIMDAGGRRPEVLPPAGNDWVENYDERTRKLNTQTNETNAEIDTLRRSIPSEPRSERLAPESKEQLDAQLAAVGEGAKPGVFYPVQNGHEVPDTPAGLARVNGEQGSLIFDPKRVPVEKAQRAVDTGENLHEVIGMSGPREGDVAVTTRDAKGVPITDEQTADPQRAMAAATPPPGGSVETRPLAAVIEERRAGAEPAGRSVPYLEFYEPGIDYEAGKPGVIEFTQAKLRKSPGEITSVQRQRFRGSNIRPRGVTNFDVDLLDQHGQVIESRGFGNGLAAKRRAEKFTAGLNARPIAAATPPEGGSVEVRPLAAVIEERQAETLAERKRRMEAEMQATNADLRGLDGLKAIIKEVDPATKMRLLQKAIPDAPPRTKQWARDELERVRRAEEIPATAAADGVIRPSEVLPPVKKGDDLGARDDAVRRLRTGQNEVAAVQGDLKALREGPLADLTKQAEAVKQAVEAKPSPAEKARAKRRAEAEALIEKNIAENEAKYAAAAPDLAPTPERKANVRADELVSKVLGDNIGAMRRQAATGAIDELVAGRPATKGVFTLPEENAVRSELGLPVRKLAPGKAGVATAPKLRGGKSLGAGAGGAGGTGPDPDLLGSRVLHALTGIKDVFRKTPGGEAPVGESVADAPAPPPAPKTGRVWDNISEVASFRNRWGSIAQNVLAELDPKAFHFVREAEAARSTAAQAVVIAKARMLKAARASLKDSGLKGRSLDLAAQTRADDGMTYLENSRNFGLNRRWRDLKEKVEGMTDEKLLEAADSHVIKIPIEALSRKSIFEGEDLAGNLAKAVKAGDAKAVRELVTTAYRDAIDAYAPREFSDSTETLESMHEKPWIKEMRDAWADGPGKLLAKVHGENPAKPGSFIPEEYMGPSKTYFPGIEADARNKTRAFERPTYGIQSNIDNHFATGISDTGYSHEVKDLVDSIGHSVVANGRASTLEQLKKTGIARPLMKGEKVGDTEPMEFGGRLVKTVAIATKAAYKIAKDGTIQKAMDVQHYVIPDQINRELAPVFEKSKIDQKGLAKIATDIQNSTQMAGITDLAYHSINIFNVGLQDAPMIARYLGGELKAAETFSDMLKIITGGDLTEAGNQARLTRMADNGQLSPRAFQSTFDSAQAEYLGIGNSLGFRKGIDPHTGKMRYNPLGFNLEPILSGTGRGMDLAIDTRARLLLDKVGEYIFERSNPSKKWADHPHEQFMWTKQLGVYHSGIEGEWIRVMKDVPILGRVGPFMTAATTMTKGGVAGLVGGTLHMPVKPGDQMLNRWRAYGVTAGLVVPVAAWVLAYKNATGKMPWEDPDSEPGKVPVSKEFRESAIGRKLFGDDLTKAGTVDVWRFNLAKRGFRALGGFGAIRQAREGGSAKDIFFGAATDAINDWSHGMAGPAVHNMTTLLTGYEPRLKYDARVGHPQPVEAYRGKGSAERNIKEAAKGLNPIIKNAFESREKEKSLGRSLLDSAGVGSMFGTVRPRMDKMQKLLSLKRPIIERQLEPEKLAEYDYIRKTTAALRHGEDKERVMAGLREKVKAGFIGEGKADKIVEAAAMPDWYDDFEGANVEDAADAWLVATPEQRKKLGGMMGEKVKRWRGLATQKNLSKVDRDRIKAKIAKAVASATP